MKNKETAVPKPKYVTLGVIFLYIAIISIMTNFIVASMSYCNMLNKHVENISANNIFVVGIIVFLIIYLLILWLLTYKISAGKDWARIAYLLIFVTVIITNIPTGFRYMNICSTCLQAAAFVCLYQKLSNQWFLSKKKFQKISKGACFMSKREDSAIIQDALRNCGEIN